VTEPVPVFVAGAGPAGLTAAWLLASRHVPVVVCEQRGQVGGLARTETHRGFRFDIGGHRFLTLLPEIQQLWTDTLGEDFLTVPRLSRIFYRGRFLSYPLTLPNVVKTVGAWEALRIVASWTRAQANGRRHADQSLEQWMTSRFGERLYLSFFKAYTEKVWGIPCTEIRADWAAQRIAGLTLRTVVSDALVGGRGSAASLARKFHYPRLGPGQMWERFADRVVAAGGDIRLGTRVAAFRHDGRQIISVVVDNGHEQDLPVAHVITSLPLRSLLTQLDPPPPNHVRAAARVLRYRDFVLVGLILDVPWTFPDTWLYIHDPGVKVGRIQNFRNWSPAMTCDDQRTHIGMEYFCSVGDAIWSLTDDELTDLAIRELHGLSLTRGARVEGACVIRETEAYPVYDTAYKTSLAVIREYLAQFRNLQTIGRNGLHRYNNQDHSMMTGLLAARNLLGERHDLWDAHVDGPPAG